MRAPDCKNRSSCSLPVSGDLPSVPTARFLSVPNQKNVFAFDGTIDIYIYGFKHREHYSGIYALIRLDDNLVGQTRSLELNSLCPEQEVKVDEHFRATTTAGFELTISLHKSRDDCTIGTCKISLVDLRKPSKLKPFSWVKLEPSCEVLLNVDIHNGTFYNCKFSSKIHAGKLYAFDFDNW